MAVIQSGPGSTGSVIIGGISDWVVIGPDGNAGVGSCTTDTARIIEAHLAATGGQRPLVFRPGTYCFDGNLNISTDSVWMRMPGSTEPVVILRNSTSGHNTLLNVTASSFECYGITFDGNKANNNAPVNLVTINTSCLRSRFDHCTFQNAKYIAGSQGVGLVIRSLVANSERHEVIACEILDNEGHGMITENARYLTIRDCKVADNGLSGLLVSNTDQAHAQLIEDVVITGNLCIANATDPISGGVAAGIHVANYFQDNIPANRDYGPLNREAHRVTISNNICRDGGGYGIVAFGTEMAIVGNTCVGNSTGIQPTVEHSVVSGNIVESNATYGMDAGWGFDVAYTGNTFFSNPVGINIAGRRLIFSGNKIDSSSLYGASLFGVEADGPTFQSPDTPNDHITFVNNMIYMSASSVGLLITDTAISTAAGNCRFVVMGNTFVPDAATEAAALRAIRYLGPNNGGIIRDNELITYWSRLLTTTGAGKVVVPDVLDSAWIDSATAVTSLIYGGKDFLGSGVAYVVVTAGGTGYDPLSTSIGFSGGGGGTGAIGQAVVYRPTGKIVGIRVLAPGSGFTSSPTVAITGGGGAGATATAVAAVAMPLLDNRKLVLTCLQAQTFNRLGSPNIFDGSGGDIAKANNSTISFRSLANAWYAK